MEHIWQLGGSTPKDIQAAYSDIDRPNVNSIANVCQALERKGYLTHRSRGRGYIYEPTMEKQAYGRTKLMSTVRRFFDDSYMSVVSAFVGEEKITEAELMQFLAEQMSKKQQ